MTAERYTAVFTGLLSLKKPGEYLYARMGEDSSSTRGYAMGRRPYGELGREVSFEDLPEGCKNLVLDKYRKMWGL